MHYYGYDGHGSVRYLTDTSGAVTDTYTYDAFGVLLQQTPASGGTPNHYRYAGEQWDADLGFYCNRARYLNANTGRFWTMDSYEGSPSDPLSLHKYLYAHANPINGIDPSGHEFQLNGVLVSIGQGLRIATQAGVNGYSVYARAKWLKDGVEFVGRSIATGTFDPLTLGMLISDVIPFGRIAGAAGKVPGLRNLLRSLGNLSNAAKGKVGEMLANAVARGKGFMPSGFKPRGNGGFDGIFRDGNGFVIVEGKLGINPILNPANPATGNPAQMTQAWIRKNIDKAVEELEEYDVQLAEQLRKAYGAGQVKGMVVKTTVDGAGNALDPEFVIKELSEIGQNAF